MTRSRRLILGAGALVVLVALIWGGVAVLADGGAETDAPNGERIRVEVLNATRTRGLARRATLHLRDRGFDVVSFGTAAEQRDSTLVLARTARADWAELVAHALGGARVESRPDTSRYLDVTVLLGRDWAPPAEPFYP